MQHSISLQIPQNNINDGKMSNRNGYMFVFSEWNKIKNKKIKLNFLVLDRYSPNQRGTTSKSSKHLIYWTGRYYETQAIREQHKN